MKLKALKIISFLAVFIIGLVLCVKEIKEPDLWWQLRAGEWMLTNQEVTKVDMFSYTHEGVEWINVKWLYEVVFASFSNLFGPEIIVFFQMLSVSIILFFLFFWVKRFIEKKDFLAQSTALGGLLFLFIYADRINFRPEMSSYVLSLIYVFLFTLYRQKKSKAIWLLIPLQILWNNIHEAYGVGLVMLAVFLTGSLIEWVINKKDHQHLAFPKEILGVVTLSFIGIIFNPIGVKLLIHTIDIFGQLGDNKYTAELHGITDYSYWNTVTISANIVFLLTTIYMFFQFKGSMLNKIKLAIKKYGLVYLTLYVAFYFLLLKASRNAYFFIMISFPIYVEVIQSIYIKLNKGAFIYYGLTITFALGFYWSIVSNVFYEKFNHREQFGIQISSLSNPFGVANFMKEQNINGQGFTDYFSSSYLLWSLQPDFKTYIDLRDLDIFTAQFMDNVMNAHYAPATTLSNGTRLFDYMETFDDFNYVVMLNGDKYDNFNRYMHQKKNYQLVYVDGLNSLYLKVKEENKDLLNKFKSKDEVFHPYAKNTTSLWAQRINKLFWPFYQAKQVSQEKERKIKEFYFSKFKTVQ